MNMYFTKITADYWTAKNKLENEAKKVALDMERRLISDNEREGWVVELQTRIDQLNQIFNRCKPLRLEKMAPHNNGNDIQYYVSGVFYISLFMLKPGAFR